MLITIGVIVVAVIALSALELWLFWRLGERDDRRRSRTGSAQRRWTKAGNDAARRRAGGAGDSVGIDGATRAYG